MARYCNTCGKSVHSLSGLSRHMDVCSLRQNARKKLRPRQQRIPHDCFPMYNTTYNPKHSREGQDSVAFDEEAWREPSVVDDDPITWSNFAGDEPPTHQFSAASSRLSTTSSCRTQTFEDVTSRQAGVPVDCELYEDENRDKPAPALYYPFSNETDYALAHWFLEAACTKGDIEKFFTDSRLKPLHEQLSFNNHDELMTLLHTIPYGIPDDKWTKVPFKVNASISGAEPQEYIIRYRNIQNAIRFLLGHRPFAEHLAYAPVQQFSTDSNCRIYNEMHTGDWWWDTQLKLPEKATIVPLLLGTDKTMLTQHHGDESAWPIYLTIGNLSRATRRKQTSTGTILIGFIPMMSGPQDEYIKAEVYHTAMALILKPIELLAEAGFHVRCADGFFRLCHPIIAGIVSDYEEQVLITGIKNGRHCTICLVPPNERENLTTRWPIRTHQSTQAQVAKQRTIHINRSDDSWVHDIHNFAWNHQYLNVHEAMMIDILHQLLKGIIMHLITWIKGIISRQIVAVRKRKHHKVTLSESSGEHQLDYRFREVPEFKGLKRFKCFSQIKQWTGVEQKAIVHQLIPVIAPLITKPVPTAMHCARAIIDFVMMAHYKSHDDKTLQYMEQALYRIDSLKEAFRSLRPQSKETEEGHFNFPKFHAITHYPDFIRKYGSADGYDSAHFEAAHKYLVKDYYNRTNKSDTYLDQIALHNIRRHNAIAMEDILLHKLSSNHSGGDMSITAQVTRPTRPLDLVKLEWELSPQTNAYIQAEHINPRQWCTAHDIALQTNTNNFIDALAVFVQERRSQLSNVDLTDQQLDCKEQGSSWATNLLVCVHPSLKCWRREGSDSSDLERLTPELLRCSPNWHNSTQWRRDYAWVQHEQHDGSATSDEREGKLIGQLQLIITVLDPKFRDEMGKPKRYSGALMKLLRYRNAGQCHAVHGMVEVENWPKSKAKHQRTLGSTRFYTMSKILRSAHIIPARDGIYYVNNFVDWDTYNTVYNPNFLAADIQVADRNY